MTDLSQRRQEGPVSLRRRRSGTVLAALGLVASVAGFAWLPFTEAADVNEPFNARLLAVTLALAGLAIAISGLVMRRTRATPRTPPARPRRLWLVLAAFGLLGLLTTAFTAGATDWSRYMIGGYLFLYGIVAYVMDHIQVRRARDATDERRADPEQGETGPP